MYITDVEAWVRMSGQAIQAFVETARNKERVCPVAILLIDVKFSVSQSASIRPLMKHCGDLRNMSLQAAGGRHLKQRLVLAYKEQDHACAAALSLTTSPYSLKPLHSKPLQSCDNKQQMHLELSALYSIPNPKQISEA